MWTLHYVKSASAVTDVTVDRVQPELILQRPSCRWLNGSFFAAAQRYRSFSLHLSLVIFFPPQVLDPHRNVLSTVQPDILLVRLRQLCNTLLLSLSQMCWKTTSRFFTGRISFLTPFTWVFSSRLSCFHWAIGHKVPSGHTPWLSLVLL
ncbi:hypothetical protein L210DRAFT_2124147 [Boletus edulis BED1]|uniref:Chitin synthase n=1 Tax=Boletus edulis BED1 TaxID=1328754 RepID=A0AAD4BVU3_BOLED|nr:hypothetical protein L210DRAFT_2124147 [Boletus edulis BED1]